MARSVAQLTMHQASGTAMSAQAAQPGTIDSKPSVAMAVGSGAMPKFSAAWTGRPTSMAPNGCTASA